MNPVNLQRSSRVIPTETRNLLLSDAPRSSNPRAKSSDQCQGAIRAFLCGAICCAIFVLTLITPALRAQDAPPPDSPRTTLYLHARIYTNDPAHPWATAMAVRDGKIICIGELATVMLECSTGDNPETIQLNNRFVMPGFNDAQDVYKRQKISAVGLVEPRVLFQLALKLVPDVNACAYPKLNDDE